MKKLLLILLAIILFNYSTYATQYESFGTSVIENNDLKKADKNALTNALLNAIKKHFENVTSDKDRIPEVTKDFIRFVKSYKILDRYIKDYTVYYHLIVKVDEITVDDLPLFFNNLRQSVIYYLFNYSNFNTDEKITNIFEKYNLSLKYEDDFLFNLPQNPSYDDLLNEFAKSNAKYLIIFKTKAISVSEETPYFCKTELITETFTKEKKFKTFKVVSTKSSIVSKDDCISNSILSSINKAVEYIKNNYIELPNINLSKNELTLTFINFSNFRIIKKLLEELDNKHYIEKYKMKSFSLNEAVFDTISPLTIDNFEEKLKLLQKSYKYNIINFGNGQIIIDFSK
ncbi:hypothetical protein FHQ18_06525 [Deferribacter autotrophicus]|uniref:DUF2066 domain-containing protein n=1 Tax=Deferribacter autotrophicus TaxID=500465 RepID=A0A5A8F3F3_9BACT|nr:hypothetical protein [Deferribacter autotrophicus]KAA0258046.1 hypothetical protein FHQ18_06525 [Deferribacter autotrophicus]